MSRNRMSHITYLNESCSTYLQERSDVTHSHHTVTPHGQVTQSCHTIMSHICRENPRLLCIQTCISKAHSNMHSNMHFKCAFNYAFKFAFQMRIQICTGRQTHTHAANAHSSYCKCTLMCMHLCVAGCCRVLQCDVVICSVLQYVTVCCRLLQGVAVLWGDLQHVAACCSVLQGVAMIMHTSVYAVTLINTYESTYTHTPPLYTYTRIMHIRSHLTYIYMCIYISVCMYTYKYICIYIHIHIYI